MKTITQTLYNFDELSTEAQNHAIKNEIEAQKDNEFVLDHVMQEINASLQAFGELCGGITSYSHGLYDQNHHVTLNDHDREEVIDQLISKGYDFEYFKRNKKGAGDCVLTSSCYDDLIIDAYLNNKSISESLCSVLESEYEYFTSENYCRETLGQNQSEIFKTDGTIF